MEPTFKIILDRIHPKKDMTLPIRLRVYQGRKYKEHSLGISIPEEDWNDQLQTVKPTNPSYKVYNTKISSIKTKVQKTLLFNEDEETSITPTDVIGELNKKKLKRTETTKPDILEYGQQQITELKEAGYVGNAIVYSCAINKLKEFAGKGSLTFEEVDFSYLEKFNNALLTDGIKVNSIANYLRTIRAIFNKAIKKKIISADVYPFSDYQIRHEETISRTLSIDEIRSIINLDLPIDSKIWHYRNLFMLSYCLIGANFSDLLTLKRPDFIDNRVQFRRKKTHKVYSIHLHPKTEELFNHYLLNKQFGRTDFVLPFVQNKNDLVQMKKDIALVIKNTNEYLDKIAKSCEINKPVTTYYARYTWSNVARDLGYSKDLIAEALGHEYGNKVTGIYLDEYSNAVIDEMNASVIEHTFGR